ncbi:YtfJ family protein [Sulfurimonas microaerophilic]|uniref:YtfJ family protein n=1 Tax=Sulfurimonas microaerophilic TaxID=3058392 RepID=UPI002714C77E|nr:YtfJ family protein [Sulfurimonas sp. hsl 1-7]
MKLSAFLFVMVFGWSLNALTIGEVPKNIVLSGANGGLVKDGSQWSSSSLKDKVLVMFYVDPDEKDLNEEFADTLKAKKFDKEKFGSIAIINMAASWKPNFAIQMALEAKQKKFPHTLYVKDMKSVVVKEWGVADNNSDILIFSKNGKLLFNKDGKLSADEIAEAIKIIENNI